VNSSNPTFQSESGTRTEAYYYVDDVKIYPADIQAPTITGPNLICSGSNYTFNLSNPDNLGFTWEVSNNLNIVSSSATQVVVQAPNNVGQPGYVRMKFTNSCASVFGDFIEKKVWVGPGGQEILLHNYHEEENVCASNVLNFAIESFVNYSNPNWLVSGAQVVQNNGDHIQVYSPPPGNYFSITLQTNNACGFGEITKWYYTTDFSWYHPTIICEDPFEPFSMNASIYPNPTSNSINIEFDESTVFAEEYEASLINNMQTPVRTLKSKKTKEVIDVRNLPKGIYYLNIIYKEGILRKQIMIER
jgi:hypothetical protein